jgi:hypothetical protein
LLEQPSDCQGLVEDIARRVDTDLHETQASGM